MPRSPNPLAADLLDVADILAAQGGRPNLQQAAMRRAVSTAYYAVFHALCYCCTDGLVRWSRTDLVAKAYRSLNHGDARKRLAGAASLTEPGSALRLVSAAFNDLQDRRHEADYDRPTSMFSRGEVVAHIEKARRAVDLIGALDENQRRHLAVDLLVVRSR